MPQTPNPTATFEANARIVDQLLTFGDLIVDAAVEGLRQAQHLLEDRNLHSAANLIGNRAGMLSNLRQSDSLRRQYDVMFSQCVVLLVSYFASAVADVFRGRIEAALRDGEGVPAASQELKASWAAVASATGSVESVFTDLLIAQEVISFQDMQSIGRAFKKYLEVEVHKNKDVNNIILGQAARHARVTEWSR